MGYSAGAFSSARGGLGDGATARYLKTAISTDQEDARDAKVRHRTVLQGPARPGKATCWRHHR
jgi:hypothetical protein